MLGWLILFAYFYLFIGAAHWVILRAGFMSAGVDRYGKFGDLVRTMLFWPGLWV